MRVFIRELIDHTFRRNCPGDVMVVIKAEGELIPLRCGKAAEVLVRVIFQVEGLLPGVRDSGDLPVAVVGVACAVLLPEQRQAVEEGVVGVLRVDEPRPLLMAEVHEQVAKRIANVLFPETFMDL